MALYTNAHSSNSVLPTLLQLLTTLFLRLLRQLLRQQVEIFQAEAASVEDSLVEAAAASVEAAAHARRVSRIALTV